MSELKGCTIERWTIYKDGKYLRMIQGDVPYLFDKEVAVSSGEQLVRVRVTIEPIEQEAGE